MASVIEMRPLDADQKAPNGVIRMDPQGALHIGMRANGAPEYEMRGMFIDVNGGVNISDSLRVLTNMRLEGFFSQTKSFFHMALGPFNIGARGWHRVNCNWNDIGQIAYVLTQPVSSRPMVVTVKNKTATGCEVYINNVSDGGEDNVWVDLFVIPLNRNK